MGCEEGLQSVLISVKGLCKNTILYSNDTISYRLSLYVLALSTCGTLNSTDTEMITADWKSASELRSRAPHTLSEKPLVIMGTERKWAALRSPWACVMQRGQKRFPAGC